MAFTSHHPVFITLTCLEWNWFLKHDTCKRIFIDALLFRVFKQDVEVYGFVIMPKHVHLIWRVADHLTLSDFQRDFLKYTAKGILVQLRVLDTTLYEKTKVNFKDRSRQI